MNIPITITMQVIPIRYCFSQGKGNEEIFDLRIDPHELLLISDPPEVLPEWTDIEFHQCPHCPLEKPLHVRCPLAVHLVNVVSCFRSIVSYEKVHLAVISEERTVTQYTTAQRAIGSLIGLISATSGCPHTVFFRPMARYHLPLASEDETVYRVTSMYLLGQYFRMKDGLDPDYEFKGLMDLYRNIEILNQAVAKRLKAASDADSTVNAIILLDLYAKVVPFVIEDSMDGIRHLFHQMF